MLKRTPNDYDRLLPYLEGALDEPQRVQMESRLAADPALAAEADRLRRTTGSLRLTAQHLGPAENSEVPPALWPRLRARLDEAAPLPAPKPRAQSWWLAGVGATAAAGMVVAAFWLPGWRAPELATVEKSSPRVVSIRPSVVAPPRSVQGTAPTPITHTLPTPGLVGNGPLPAELTAKKLPTAAPPQKVAAVPAKPPAPEYSVGDPFALPSAPAYYNEPAPKILGSTVDEQRRLKMTGEVSPLGVNASPRDAQRRARTLKPSFATRGILPPSPASAPLTAQGQTPQAASVNGVVAPGGFGSSFDQGTNPAQQSQSLAGQAAAAPAAPAMGKMLFRQPKAQVFALQNTQQNHQAAPVTLENANNSQDAADAPENLDTWQKSLAAAVQPASWGENERVQQANQALMSVKMSGKLDDLRVRLEARQAQSPSDIVNGRMLASVYEFGFSTEAALRERRRITGLENAVGEDWFALAQLEEKRGNVQAARTAYRRSLESPTPPTPFHAAIARERS